MSRRLLLLAATRTSLVAACGMAGVACGGDHDEELRGPSTTGGTGSSTGGAVTTGGVVAATGGAVGDTGAVPSSSGGAEPRGGVPPGTGGDTSTGGVVETTGGVAPSGGEWSSGGLVQSTGGDGGIGAGPTTGGLASTGGVPSSGGTAQAGAGASTGGAPRPVCQGAFDGPALDGSVHTVTVASTHSWGELPHFWSTFGTGHLGLFLREERGWGETLQAHLVDAVQHLGLTSVRQHGLFHDDIGIYSEANGTPAYDFARSDEIFDLLVDNGVAPIVELGSMPRALARDPSRVHFNWEMGISPPKDWQLWQELVYRFVAHCVERYGADEVEKWYFEVWNEPECCPGFFWSGTLDEYYQLYDYSAAGVRAALPNGRVGGPAASNPEQVTGGFGLGQGFLEHVANAAAPGQLDFFTYHTWLFVGASVGGYFEGLDFLGSYGVDVPIAISEFGPTWEFGLSDEPQETRQGAAFVAQTFSDLSQRCAREGRPFPLAYAWWVLSDVFEEDTYRENDPFIGCMGLVSRENIHKPAYNVYRFLAQLGDEQVALSVTGPGGVGGLATRDPGGGVQVLIYNGQQPGLGPEDHTYYQVAAAQRIGLTVSGLDPGLPYDVMAYRVDETRGNAYATWEQLGRPNMGVMSDADWQALRDTMDSPAEPLGEALCGEAFSGAFELPSPGVLFVRLVPTMP